MKETERKQWLARLIERAKEERRSGRYFFITARELGELTDEEMARVWPATDDAET